MPLVFRRGSAGNRVAQQVIEVVDLEGNKVATYGTAKRGRTPCRIWDNPRLLHAQPGAVNFLGLGKRRKVGAQYR